MAKGQKSSRGSAAKPKTPPDQVEDAVVIEEAAGADEAVVAPEPADAPKPETAEAPEPESAQAPREEEEGASPELANTGGAEPEAPPKPHGSGQQRRSGVGGFLGLLLGGVAAAIIGFAAARYVVPDGWPFPGVEPKVDPLVAIVEAQGADMADLASRVGALEADTAAQDALSAMRADLSALQTGLSTRFDELSGRLDDIEARLDAVEKLAPEGSQAAAAAAAAYDRELTALREMFEAKLSDLEAQQADASVLEADAAEAARQAAGRATLAQVTAALDNGQPFASALSELTAATGIAVPENLSAVAETGVPTLAALQEAFPPAARAALNAAIKAAVEEGKMSRMTAFLRTQLGARSLEPREGNDPDAILSRAEAALKTGDIAAALTEIEAMPEAAAPALADWVRQAQTRQAALDASAALARQLNGK